MRARVQTINRLDLKKKLNGADIINVLIFIFYNNTRIYVLLIRPKKPPVSVGNK